MSGVRGCVTLRLLSFVSVKHILVKLSAVAVVLLENTFVSEASRSLHEQFKSTGAVSIYPAPSSSQFNVHNMPQMNSKTTTLHPSAFSWQLHTYCVCVLLASI
jgi:hypothetical protein